jgi:peptidoglycan/LPS O-acetylase OafA/YrhL
VRDPLPAPRPPRSAIVAVVAGLGVDLGGTLVSSVIVAVLYTLALVVFGGDPFGPNQPALGIVGFFTGGGFSFLGGYVCARIVRRNERRVTVIMASISTTAGLLMALLSAWAAGAAPTSWGWRAIELAATFLLVTAGGELGRRRNGADARQANVATAA